MALKSKIIISISIIINLIFYSYASASPKHAESDAAIQNAVLFYINEYRQHHGLSKLTMNNHMVIQAKKHSQDMANHRMGFGHQDFGKRILVLRRQIKNSGGGAENVAYNYKNAHEVVSNWVRSPGHQRNIVGNYNLTGIGVARDKQGKLYYTQIFLQTGKNPTNYSARRAFVRMNPFFSISRSR